MMAMSNTSVYTPNCLMTVPLNITEECQTPIQQCYHDKNVKELRREAEDRYSHSLKTKIKDNCDLFAFGDIFFAMLIPIADRIGSRGKPRTMFTMQTANFESRYTVRSLYQICFWQQPNRIGYCFVWRSWHKASKYNMERTSKKHQK